MKFKIDININSDDYMSFSRFNLLRSAYGRHYIRANRILISTLSGFIALLILIGAILSGDPLIYLTFFILLSALIAYNIALRRIFTYEMEKSIKKLLENGEKLFTPNQILEFHEDMLISRNEDKLTEVNYKDIERMCVVDNEHIYLYINHKNVHIINLSDFETQEQYESFIDFIDSHGIKIDFYYPGSKKPTNRSKKL